MPRGPGHASYVVIPEQLDPTQAPLPGAVRASGARSLIPELQFSVVVEAVFRGVPDMTIGIKAPERTSRRPFPALDDRNRRC